MIKLKLSKRKMLIYIFLLLLATLIVFAFLWNKSFFWAKNGDLTSGESVMLSILSPLILKDRIKELSPETRRYRREQNAKHEARMQKLQANIPDMVVKEINYDENKGKWQMRLEDPDNPENHAILTKYFWLNQRPDKDILNLQEGDKVVFGEGSLLSQGWLLYDDSGKQIAYAVPEDVHLDNYSEQF